MLGTGTGQETGIQIMLVRRACKKSYHSQHSLTLLHFPRKTTLTYTFVSKAFIKNPFECVSQKLGDTAHAIINRK